MKSENSEYIITFLKRQKYKAMSNEYKFKEVLFLYQ